jgi:hypothetical protein
VVAEGTEVVSLVTARPGMVVAMVPDRRATQVLTGAKVSLQRPGTVGQRLTGRVVDVAPVVDELPSRFRPAPAISAFGRRVFIRLDQAIELLPGEPLNVRL